MTEEGSASISELQSDTSPLRVLMVTFRALPFLGGVELHVDQVARRLAALGVDITVLTTDTTGTLPAEENVDGVKIKRVRAWPANRDYYFAPQIYSEVANGNWDLVHVQAYHTFVGPLAMLAARRAHIPYVVTFHAGGHSSRLRHRLRPLQLSLVRPLLARADRLIALAPFEIEHYATRLRVPRDRFALISNGSDLPIPPDLDPNARDGSLIASLGRLERYKGHQRVIAAMPHILQRLPHARLWIAGHGPYEQELRDLTVALGLSDSVEIRAVPIEEREQMARELSRVKVVVSMSEFETQPIAVLEARALGCWLVVADTPGLSALAADGLAHAVPLETAPEELASIVIEELARPGAAEPVRLPTWDDCAAGLLELYESVAQRSRSSEA